jgi:hypothetical protein
LPAFLEQNAHVNPPTQTRARAQLSSCEILQPPLYHTQTNLRTQSLSLCYTFDNCPTTYDNLQASLANPALHDDEEEEEEDDFPKQKNNNY